MSKHQVLSAAVALLAATFTMGAGGRIPIYTVTTITESGSYVLTRDVSTAGGSGITVEASDVTIDLAGHTISSAGTGSGVLLESSATDVTIRNGRIRGTHYGISSASDTTKLRVRIENLEIEDVRRGVTFFNPEHLSITGCRFTNTAWEGIYLGHSSLGGAFTARIAGNDFHSIGYSAMMILGLNGGEVRDNTITDFGLSGSGTISGIFLGPAGDNTIEVGGTLVSGNTIDEGTGTTVYAGIVSDLYRNQDRISGNTIASTGDFGVRVNSDYARVGTNHITDAANTAVYVQGYGCLVENNTLVAASYGIFFDSSGGGSVYRGNVAIDIGTAAVSGTATDGGDNVFP